MWEYKKLLKKIWGYGVFHCCCTYSTSSRLPFSFEKALVVSKMTRYELERYHNSHLSSEQIERWLKQRGSDYESLIGNHNLHKNFENNVVGILEKMSIQTRVVNRLNYRPTDVEWCDVVIPVGGDGTFLVAASCVSNNIKPVIGLNSDPIRSEGFLCLKKKYSSDVKSALLKIIQGDFSWLFRSRIRITLKGLNIRGPVQLSEKEVMFKSPLSRKYEEFVNNGHSSDKFEEKILPYRALNEVFIGECLSARVSYFELQFPKQSVTKVKSSGLCVCTGTGSSSWNYSMNRLDENDAQQLLKIADISLSSVKAKEIVTRYNNSLIYKPDYHKMIYTIRDLISAGVWPNPPGLSSRGITECLSVRSKCIDAGLVIDGGLLYAFNDGTVAKLEIHPEDALRTVILD